MTCVRREAVNRNVNRLIEPNDLPDQFTTDLVSQYLTRSVRCQQALEPQADILLQLSFSGRAGDIAETQVFPAGVLSKPTAKGCLSAAVVADEKSELVHTIASRTKIRFLIGYRMPWNQPRSLPKCYSGRFAFGCIR